MNQTPTKPANSQQGRNFAVPSLPITPIQLGLPRIKQAPQLTRRHTHHILGGWHVAQADIDTVELVVSELVTNAIRHGDIGDGEPARLSLRLVGAEVVVEVVDASPVMPRVVAASEWDEAGRGLQLVEALASSWGATPVVADGKQCGKRVWARVPVRITAGAGVSA